MPRTTLGQVLGKQVLRSGTSVGAQYREGMRSRSKAEFVSKLEGALQEIEETKYWMELIVESRIMSAGRLTGLAEEADELTAMLTASVRTTKRGLKAQRSRES